MNFDFIFHTIVGSPEVLKYKKGLRIDKSQLLKSLNFSGKELLKFKKLNLFNFNDLVDSSLVNDDVSTELYLTLLVVLDILLKKGNINLDSNINPSLTIREYLFQDKYFEIIETLYSSLIINYK